MRGGAERPRECAHARSAGGSWRFRRSLVLKTVDADRNPDPDQVLKPVHANPQPNPNPAQVLKTVDVSYGGENGFNQAIEPSSLTYPYPYPYRYPYRYPYP